jgi:hypothetical protein
MERGFWQLEGEASIPIIYHERRREKRFGRHITGIKRRFEQTLGKIWKVGDYGGGKENTRQKHKNDTLA